MTTILIAEDNLDIQQLIARRLVEKGFEVSVARNGREAFEQAKTIQPDLVLMDMNMPDVDGWEASCQFKQDGKLKKIPIIALTAYALPADQARAKQAGCDDYHPKPFDFNVLLNQINQLLAASGKK